MVPGRFFDALSFYRVAGGGECKEDSFRHEVNRKACNPLLQLHMPGGLQV